MDERKRIGYQSNCICGWEGDPMTSPVSKYTGDDNPYLALANFRRHIVDSDTVNWLQGATSEVDMVRIGRDGREHMLIPRAVYEEEIKKIKD